MISRNDGLSASDLDALVPRYPPSLSLRALPTEHAAPALPLLRRPLRAPTSGQKSVTAPPIEPRLKAYWADPRRTFWTPILAGASISLWVQEHARFPFPGMLAPSALLVSECVRAGKEMDDLERSAVAELALHGVMALRALWPEARALAELGLDGSLSLAERRAALEERLATTRQPVEWLTVLLPSALLPDAVPVREFLTGTGQYRGLGARFAELAERQGLTTWEDGIRESIGFWGDPRGNSVLRALLAGSGRDARPREKKESLRRDGRSHLLRKLDAQLAQAKEAEAMARAEAEARRERLAAAQREAAEARQSRDRVAERLRRAEEELEALRALVPEPQPSSAEPEPIPVRSATMEATVPDKIADSEPDPATVLAGRRVYLYTGVEREAAREAMGRALEEHGAVCEVFDGNSLGQLGPSRFPADALVIIETSHLCHNGNNIVQARARASGAWCFQGKAGSGSLARRVAERWWMTHPGEDQRRPA